MAKSRYNREYYLAHCVEIKQTKRAYYRRHKEDISMKRREQRVCRQCGAKLTKKNCVPFLYGMEVRWRGWCKQCWTQRIREIGGGHSVAHTDETPRLRTTTHAVQVKSCGSCAVQMYCSCGRLGLSDYWIKRCKDYRPQQ